MPASLAAAACVGALATLLALRFDSRTVAALGILGALLAPVAVGAGPSAIAIVFAGVALASAVGVLLWRRWDWLAVAAFAVTTPQLFAWVTTRPPSASVLAVLAAFWALYAVAALGHEVRARTRLRPSSSLLLALNAAVTAGLGHAHLALGSQEGLGDAWISAVAVAHLVLGLGALRSGRTSREIALLTCGVGVALADVAFGLALGGAVLPLGWAAASVAFAALTRAAGSGSKRSAPDEAGGRIGLGAHLALAICHLVLFDAPWEAIAGAADATGRGARDWRGSPSRPSWPRGSFPTTAARPPAHRAPGCRRPSMRSASWRWPRSRRTW